MTHKYVTLEDTVPFWFAGNDTSGSGADGATGVYDVRLSGAAASAIPTLSGSAVQLTHVNFPAGVWEVTVAATAANGFAADSNYGVFATLAVDSQNPTGFIGSFITTALATAASITTAQNDLDIITGASGVNLLTATQASIDAIEADTNELQTDDIPGAITALNDVSVNDILTTQMTESYAADGAAPTLAQSLLLIQQQLGDFAISGTTITVKKVDGSTTAATFTLDSSTAPTSSTRAS